jgi:hypothetical protein
VRLSFLRAPVIQAGAVSWFYYGPGGNFEYWPEGFEGSMFMERPPFRNVAIIADNDRMHHRIGRVGEAASKGHWAYQPMMPGFLRARKGPRSIR